MTELDDFAARMDLELEPLPDLNSLVTPVSNRKRSPTHTSNLDAEPQKPRSKSKTQKAPWADLSPGMTLLETATANVDDAYTISEDPLPSAIPMKAVSPPKDVTPPPKALEQPRATPTTTHPNDAQAQSTTPVSVKVRYWLLRRTVAYKLAQYPDRSRRADDGKHTCETAETQGGLQIPYSQHGHRGVPFEE